MVVNSFDIAIIGGGVQGLFLAYYAKKKFKDKTLALFESKVIGCGISAYSGHLHHPYGAGEKNLLTKNSISLYQELKTEFKDFPIEMLDFVGVCKTDNLESIVTDIVGNFSIVKHNDGNALYSITNECSTISGMKAFVTKRTIAHYLMELITRMGVVIFEGTNIIDSQKIDGGFVLSSNNGNSYRASLLFNTSGLSLHKYFKYKYPVRTKKVVAFHINSRPWADAPVVYFFDDDAFLLPQPYFSRYLFSFKCEDWDVEINPDQIFYNKQDLKSAQNILDKYNTGFTDKILGGQAYIDLYNTPSSSPLIVEVEQNNILIGATGGAGIRLAPSLALEALSKCKLV